jgi:hypothetical protein
MGMGLAPSAASYSWQKAARVSSDRKVEIPAMAPPRRYSQLARNVTAGLDRVPTIPQIEQIPPLTSLPEVFPRAGDEFNPAA